MLSNSVAYWYASSHYEEYFEFLFFIDKLCKINSMALLEKNGIVLGYLFLLVKFHGANKYFLQYRKKVVRF